MHDDGGADRSACIVRCGGYKHIREITGLPDQFICHAIERNAAGEAQFVEWHFAFEAPYTAPKPNRLKTMCRHSIRTDGLAARQLALSCRSNRALHHLLLRHERLPGLILHQLTITVDDARSASLARGDEPGGPCSSSCSIPRAVRAHMSMSGSRGNAALDFQGLGSLSRSWLQHRRNRLV